MDPIRSPTGPTKRPRSSRAIFEGTVPPVNKRQRVSNFQLSRWSSVRADPTASDPPESSIEFQHHTIRLHSNATIAPSVAVRNQPWHLSTEEPDFRIAIDFGTTYTTIAFVKRDEPNDAIHTIDGFQDDRCLDRNGRQVPTESVYFLARQSDTQSSATGDDPSMHTSYQCKHGYEAQRFLELPRRNHTIISHIRRIKLLLDESAIAQTARDKVVAEVAKLKKHELAHSEEHAIQNLLVYYFHHTKEVLGRDHGFTSRSTGKFVLLPQDRCIGLTASLQWN